MRVIKFFDVRFDDDHFVTEQSDVFDGDDFIGFTCKPHDELITVHEICKIPSVKAVMADRGTNLMDSLRFIEECEDIILQYLCCEEAFITAFNYLWNISREVYVYV